jgi:hypothetical protein
LLLSGVLALLVIIQVANTLYDMFYSTLSNEQICSSFTFLTAVMTFCLITVLIICLMIGIHMTNRRMKKHRIQLSTHLLHANKSLHELLFSESVEDYEECDSSSHVMAGGAGSGQAHHPSRIRNKKKNRMQVQMQVPSPPGSKKESNKTEKTEDSFNFLHKKEEAIAQIQECVESANAVIQTVVETDDVQPLKIMNMHVEKEHIFTVISTVLLYGLVLYNFCDDGLNFIS